MLAVVLSVAACDCEDQLRKLVSNSGDRRIPAKPQPNPGGPSEVEPNDSPDQATPLELGSEMRDIRGTIGQAGDVDWFSVTSRLADAVQLEVVAPQQDLVLTLEVAGGEPVVYDAAPAGQPEHVEALKVGTQPVRFSVHAKDGTTGDYTLVFRRQLAAEGMEAEPNDDASVATALSLPGMVRGTYGRPGDRDVYRLAGDSNRPFALTIGALDGGRHTATIFGDTALKEALLTLQVATETTIPNLVLSATEPRFLVLTPIGSPRPDATYTLRGEYHPPIEDALEHEPNDTVAQPLTLGAPEDGVRRVAVSGYLHSSDDRDRFVVAPPTPALQQPPDVPPVAPELQQADGVDYLAQHRGKAQTKFPLRATLSWPDITTSLGIVWTGADGRRADFRQVMEKPEVIACGLNLDDGPATFEVRSEILGAAPRVGVPQYTLVVEETSQQDANEVEPNDSRAKADTLEPRRRATFATPDDVDIYAFAVHGETQRVQVRAGSRAVDLILKVTDDSGGILANVNDGETGAAELVALDLPEGLYFAEVRWNGGDICAPYEIEVSR